jgi:hypothetical protein
MIIDMNTHDNKLNTPNGLKTILNNTERPIPYTSSLSFEKYDIDMSVHT